MPDARETPIETLADLVLFVRQKWGEPESYFSVRRGGGLERRSATELVDGAHALALALEARGVQKGDRLALMLESVPEWHLIDFACQLLGAVSVPIFPNLPSDPVGYILRDSGAQWVFYRDAAKRELLEDFSRWEAKPPQLVALDVDARAPRGLTLDELLEEGRTLALGRDSEEMRGRCFAPDPASILYTSGTTGDPKGVVLTHRNFVSNLLGAAEIYPGPGGEEEQSLCLLPLSHVFQRTISHTMLYLGVPIHYVVEPEPDAIRQAMQEMRPTTLATVPLLFERLHQKILAGVEELPPRKRKFFHRALEVSQNFIESEQRGGAGMLLRVRKGLARKLVLHKIEEGVGGRLQWVIGGGAPMPRDVELFFHAVGIAIYNGYGLTETSPMVSVNAPENHRLGSAGKPAGDAQLRIAEDGEVLVRGSCVMQGYWRKPEATTEVLTADGWFQTGDLGEIDDDGFLFITGRKKDLLVMADGTNVAPVPIEQLLAGAPVISQAVVVGDDREHLSALIVPDFEALAEHGEPAAVVADPEIRTQVEEVVETTNRFLAKHERVRAFRLLGEPFTVEGGTLTPTLKVRRRRIMARYRELVDGMYT